MMGKIRKKKMVVDVAFWEAASWLCRLGMKPLVGGFKHFDAFCIFTQILGVSWSNLTRTYFFRWVETQPPTRPRGPISQWWRQEILDFLEPNSIPRNNLHHPSFIAYTPWKINGWNLIMMVWFRWFSFLKWVIFRFQPLIFRGVVVDVSYSYE